LGGVVSLLDVIGFSRVLSALMFAAKKAEERKRGEIKRKVLAYLC